MIHKLTVTFEETRFTKLEEDSKPYVVSTWKTYEFYRTNEEKELILKDLKKKEYSKSHEVSAMPYRHEMVEEITEFKIKSIGDISLSCVTKYFFMYSDTIRVNERSDGFGGTEYCDEVSEWSKSKYFDDEETAYFESLKYNNTTPIMKGVIYEESVVN